MSDPRPFLHRGLRRLTIATVAIYIALAGLGAVGWVSAMHQRDALEHTTKSVNSALCTLRSDLESRVASSRQFLADHPDGIPGISPAFLKSSIDNQQRTVDALNGLVCGSENG